MDATAERVGDICMPGMRTFAATCVAAAIDAAVCVAVFVTLAAAADVPAVAVGDVVAAVRPPPLLLGAVVFGDLLAARRLARLTAGRNEPCALRD